MSAKRILMLMLALTAAFTLGLGVVSAQDDTDSRNGRGTGKGFQGGRNGGGPSGTNRGAGLQLRLPPASTDDLPQEIIDLMIDGWMDEQHAYAVYDAAIDQFGEVRPFANIQRSEAQHVAAWETLFVRYGIAIPDVPALDLPEFASITEACVVAAEAEVANFELYDAMMAAFEPYPDLAYVAKSLSDASESNHLPAFEMCAGR